MAGGANNLNNGGAGGYNGLTQPTGSGENGMGAGGGGYRGGKAGNIRYHSHSGTAGLSYANGCYTRPVSNGGGHCGGGDAMWWCSRCGAQQGIGNRLGSNHNPGCPVSGSSGSNGCSYHTSPCGDWVGETYRYELNCGKTTSTLEVNNPSYGGTNYIRSDATNQSSQSGINNANGYAKLTYITN